MHTFCTNRNAIAKIPRFPDTAKLFLSTAKNQLASSCYSIILNILHINPPTLFHPKIRLRVRPNGDQWQTISQSKHCQLCMRCRVGVGEQRAEDMAQHSHHEAVERRPDRDCLLRLVFSEEDVIHGLPDTDHPFSIHLATILYCSTSS